MAGALGVQFGGMVSYFGKEVRKPTIGDKKKEFELEDIKKNIRIMYTTSLVGIIIFTVVKLAITVLLKKAIFFKYNVVNRQLEWREKS